MSPSLGLIIRSQLTQALLQEGCQAEVAVTRPYIPFQVPVRIINCISSLGKFRLEHAKPLQMERPILNETLARYHRVIISM